MEPLLYILAGAAGMLFLVWLRERYIDFAAQRPADYEDDPGERFDLPRHLAGGLVCEGVIFGITGRVVSRFVGDFDVRWSGRNHCVMKEHFLFDGGEVQDRAWDLELAEDGQIRATAEDVVGECSGWQKGPAVQMRYRLRLPETAGGHVLSATDWMYLTPDGSIVNRSQFRKFGIRLFEIVAVIRRSERG